VSQRTSGYPEPMQHLIEQFSQLPGVGIRTAERFAFYILTAKKENTDRLADAVRKTKESIRYCRQCFNLSEKELCAVCSNPSRDTQTLCIVGEPKDIVALEKSGAFNGLYHVLLGVLSPLDGIGPNDLKIPELLSRLGAAADVREILLATTSDTEGEATAIYLAKALRPFKIRITRLAQGVPVGTELEFADRATLMRAVEARQEIRA
jgi:recombination protein RecR